ncbi:hypothetical protein ACFQ16_04790 [Saccharopolyspora rosea]|uniref:PH domain-containing protein n=1 Tax=Saccharopolyspora rosea TaxID=524884 RepID=A0ABW3FPV7_9PSEU
MEKLPTQPDAQTGEPRPPAAPTQHAEGYNERKTSRIPPPPKGQGPVLEWYRDSRLASWLGGLVPAGAIFVAGIWHSGLPAVTSWALWVFVVAAYAFGFYASRRDVVTAGSDWLRYSKHWVRTYELTSIRLVPRGANGHELVLEDAEGRAVGITPRLLQANRRLWDLVYLGMRYSAANGANIDRTARGAFPEVAAASPRDQKHRDTASQPCHDRDEE